MMLNSDVKGDHPSRIVKRLNELCSTFSRWMRSASVTLLATDEYRKFKAGCGFVPGGIFGGCC